MPATPYGNLPIAGKDSWDASAADARVQAWAKGDGDDVDLAKYAKAFLWSAELPPTKLGDCKLPFADVVDDKLQAVPGGLSGCLGAINGSRGGLKIPEGDVAGVKSLITKYYGKMDKDDPFKEKAARSQRERKTMNVPFHVKSVDVETGEFEGYAAIFDNVDAGNDVVMPGAFKRTLDHAKGVIPILWFHDPTQPIGLAYAVEDPKGLCTKGRINTDTQVGRETLSNMKFSLDDETGSLVDCMSIGYEIVQKSIEKGIRYLKELVLPEASFLTKNFAMNEEALLVSVKSVTDFQTALTEAQNQQNLNEQRWQLSSALGEVVEDLCEDETMTDAEKVGALRESMAQFVEAYCAWFAQWLAADVDEDGDVASVGYMSRDLEAIASKMVEVKEGRTFSASNMTTLRSALATMAEQLEALGTMLDKAEANAPVDGSDDSKAKSRTPDDSPLGDGARGESPTAEEAAALAAEEAQEANKRRDRQAAEVRARLALL